MHKHSLSHAHTHRPCVWNLNSNRLISLMPFGAVAKDSKFETCPHEIKDDWTEPHEKIRILEQTVMFSLLHLHKKLLSAFLLLLLSCCVIFFPLYLDIEKCKGTLCSVNLINITSLCRLLCVEDVIGSCCLPVSCSVYSNILGYFLICQCPAKWMRGLKSNPCHFSQIRS